MVDEENKKYKDKDWLYNQYYNNGKSQSEIAKMFGVSQTTIKYWMDKYNIDSRGPGGLVEPDFDIQKCIDMYKSGHGMRKVSNEVDASRNTISRWLDEYNVEKHPTGMRKVNSYIKEQICELYSNGLTQEEIVEEIDIDITQTTVSKTIINSNIETRNKAGFGQVCYSNNGLKVKSKLEQLTANWLEENVSSFRYEPEINGTDYIPDFIYDGKIIEVWGIIDSEKYNERRKMKTEKYNKLGYNVVSVEADYQSVEETLSKELGNGGEK